MDQGLLVTESWVGEIPLVQTGTRGWGEDQQKPLINVDGPSGITSKTGPLIQVPSSSYRSAALCINSCSFGGLQLQPAGLRTTHEEPGTVLKENLSQEVGGRGRVCWERGGCRKPTQTCLHLW